MPYCRSSRYNSFTQKQGLFYSFNPYSTMARSHTTRNRDFLESIYKLQFLNRSRSKFSVALYVVNLIEYFECLTSASGKRGKLLITRGRLKGVKSLHLTITLHSCFITPGRKNQFRETEKNAQSAKINSRKTFAPHGTPTQLVLYRPSIIIIIYLQFQFNQFNETCRLGWCPARECRFSRIKLTAGLLLPFIRCQLSVVVNFSFSYNT